MAIEVSKLRDYFAETLGSSGSSFEKILISGVNDVSRDLRSETLLNPAPSGEDTENVEQINETLDLDNKYVKVYKDGIRFYMGLAGEWGREPSGNEERLYMRSLGQAQRMAYKDEDPDTGFVR